MTPECFNEGVVNSISPVVQDLRKKLGLEITDYIDLAIASDEPDVTWALGKLPNMLRDRCRVKDLIPPHCLLNCPENPIGLEGVEPVVADVTVPTVIGRQLGYRDVKIMFHIRKHV